MAHITNKQYVPPVYATEAQPSTSTIPNIHHQEIDQYEEMERQARIRNDESMARKIHSLKEAFKNIQTSKGHEGLEYEDLCMHPDVQLPIGYKVPKFDLFDGKGNPRAHLRSYCDKLVGVGKDQAIIMKLFIRSLTGEALSTGTQARTRENGITGAQWHRILWIETFREYAIRWRAEAAKVQPPMAESEMTTLFVQSMKDATYYEKMISVIGRNFSEVVRMGDFIEEGIKTGRITNLAKIAATSKAIQ
ncbi:hypothetical protein K7X08_037603 [Anisodus acutangulus]|uniref:Gag protein n=1 Tax=Anisodus acutangulus TaxID=402998 RepID=A0A9Q1N2U0_9SOLA|nr:hypothetical protein K7X08_037603 [Anisodus acutangulus]